MRLLTLIVIITLLYISAWLDSDSSPLLIDIDKRIESLTGLSLDTAETLQVRILPILLLYFYYNLSLHHNHPTISIIFHNL